MYYRRAHCISQRVLWNEPATRRVISAMLIAVTALTPGCWLPNGFIDPTKVGRFPISDYTEVGIRRVLTARETPGGPANASEPKPEDLLPANEEYRVGANDTLAIIVDDLLHQGVQEQALLQVSGTGFIRIPVLGSVKVAGLSEREVEQDLQTRFKSGGILPDPQVRVQVREARQRVFSIIGSVTAAGQYQISDPEMRLLDAIGVARDIGPEVKKLYVIRREEAMVRSGAGDAVPDAPTRDSLVIPPPGEPGDEYSSFSTSFGLNQEAGEKKKERNNDVAELLEVLSPGKKKNESQSTTTKARRADDGPFAPLVYDPETGKPVEAKNESEAVTPAEKGRTGADATMPADNKAKPDFDWSKTVEPSRSQRVIAIDVGALRAGDSRYNIVIRNRDVIEVPVDTGVFYMMGEINRPGVYALNGREITIKQAVAIGGGFGSLAWPARCEIIRREKGTDKQLTISVDLDQIFGGLADDVLLKDEDIVNIGSHFIAPFLFVIRNSFRFTYGFGFVYDRNFADKDSISGKSNPEELRRARRQQLGLPF